MARKSSSNTAAASSSSSPISLANERRYWVVSPNVRYNEATVGEWREKSVRECAAFMGYSPDDYNHNQIGPKFAGATKRGIMPNDVVIIARRHNGDPEIVGFGVVCGEYEKLKEGGSLRRLFPFIPWSRPPSGIPLKDVLHIKALFQLRPEQNGAHEKVDQNRGRLRVR